MIRLEDIRQAQRKIRRRIQPTPLFLSAALSEMVDGEVWLKAENLQRTGSFKIRGATNRISSLSREERRRGVVAASAGNHAQGVALAAALQHVPATILMPQEAPVIKYQKTRGYGARVLLEGEAIEDALASALRLRDERRLTFIHPFDDPLIQAGQGTVGLEILKQLPQVDSVVVPVGGGGLVSGIAVAIKEQRPQVKVFGVQARNAAPAAASLKAGRRVRLRQATTMADGIRVRDVADSTLAIMQRYLEGIVTVSDEEISRAMVMMLERSRLLVEGAGAAGVAALLGRRLPGRLGRTVLVLSGGNIDTNLLSRVIERGLTAAGRHVLLRVRIPNRPGYLKQVLEVVAGQRANIVDIQHHRTGWRVPLGDVEVEMLLETRHPGHGRAILEQLKALGMAAELWGRRAYRQPSHLQPPRL